MEEAKFLKRGGRSLSVDNTLTMASFVNSEAIFELAGGREMVSKARATELLEAACGNGDVTTIRLSNKSFGQDAAEIMAERLRYA